jgi:trigger factor
MNIEVKKLDRLKRVLRIIIEGEEFLNKKKEVYEDIGKNLKVAGFRPGRAPLDIVEKRYGKVLEEEFLNRTLPFFYQSALLANGLLAASAPKIYDVSMDKQRLSFSAEVEIKPEVTIKESDYKRIKIRDKEVEVEELEIEKVLTSLKDGIKKVIKKDLNDEELARWSGYSSLTKFRAAIKGEILVEKLRARRESIDKQIVNHLLKSVKLEVPKSEVEYYHKELVDREIYNLRLQGVSEEDIEKQKKDIGEKLLPLAEEKVKIAYIIRAIAKKENIEVETNLLGEAILGLILSEAEYSP